jgi:hypothetical protein
MRNVIKRYKQGKLIEQQVTEITQPWPVFLTPLKLLAKPEDKGLGDIVAREIGPIGGKAFKKWYKVFFKKGCGCGARQESWNAKWPL